MACVSSSIASPCSRPLKLTQAPSRRIFGLSSVSLSIGGSSFPAIGLWHGATRSRVLCAAKPETVKKVCDIVRKQLAIPYDSAVTADSKFAALGADSLDTELNHTAPHIFYYSIRVDVTF